MLLNIFIIVSSVLLGSVIARIGASILVFQKGINLISTGVIEGGPLYTADYLSGKSFDLMEFPIFVLTSLGLFAILTFIFRKLKSGNAHQILVGASLTIFSVIANIATLFADSSGSQTIIFISAWCLVTAVLAYKVPAKLPAWEQGKSAVFNGVITGFYLSVLTHKFSTSVALPIALFAATPIYFYMFSEKFKFLKNPSFIFLMGAMFVPFNKLFLLLLPVFSALFIFFSKNKVPLKTVRLLESVYPALILIIFLYNPTFYIGTFDTVEEGLWAGWLQRMLDGKTMYRDFAAYHPPLLSGGLYVFSKVFGESLYNLRLYFHLLQITGPIIIYLIVSKLTKSNWIRIAVFILIVAYSTSLVRNNMEIRLASGLIPLLFVYWYNERRQKVFLWTSGILSGLALLISVETGIASVAATGIAVLLSASKKTFWKVSLPALAGGTFVVLSVLSLLFINGSLSKFVEYVYFYASSFSLGYTNTVIERPDTATLVQWYLVNKYVASSAFLWELTKYVLVGGAAFAAVLKIKKEFGINEILFSGVAVFGLVLSRSALGRSDVYHIAFAWVVCLILLAYIFQYISSYSRVIPAVILTLLIIFVGREQTQVALLQNQIIKFQTYGNPSGGYPSYKNPRAGILTGIETKTEIGDAMISYITENVGKDEYIYVFPHAPEIYFLADRSNATSFDTPINMFAMAYQKQTVEELKKNKPKLIIYNPNFSIAGISRFALGVTDNYIIENYVSAETFGENVVMRPK